MKKRVILPLIAVGILLTTVSFKSDFYEISKQLEIFTTLYKELDRNYVDDTNPAELMESAIKGMLENLDPYTRFWNEQDVEAAKIRNKGEYTGIGAVVRTVKDKIIIVEPHLDYPADKAGLKAGDEIIKINNVVVADFKEDAGELLKGAAKSTVDITYKRQGEVKKTRLIREEIEVNAVPFYRLLDDKTGYIVLSKFNKKASEQTIEALEELKKQGATKIILDLRNNPGGLLNEAINVTNIFVPKQTLVTKTKSVVEKFNKEYFTRKEPVDTTIPLVVLVNNRSASASEIVAGSIQDLDRGVVIGARSFGKGLVQRPKDLEYGTKLKVTISRYYTPSGRCIQALVYGKKNNEAERIAEKDYHAFKTKNGRTVYDGGGILPDVILKSSESDGITKALLNEHAIFDFATKYYYSHKIDTIEDFSFTNADFDEFKKFLANSGFEYETETEKKLKEVQEVAKKEQLLDNIKENFKNLEGSLSRSKDKQLNAKKDQIISLLTDEIVKRYFYKQGLYKYYVKSNPEIIKSKEILGNPSKYQGILK